MMKTAFATPIIGFNALKFLTATAACLAVSATVSFGQIALPASFDWGTDTGKDNPTGVGFVTSNQSNSSWSLQTDSHRLLGSSSQNNSSSGVASAQFDFDATSDPGFLIQMSTNRTHGTGSDFGQTSIFALGSAAPVAGNPSTMTNGIQLRLTTSQLQLLNSTGASIAFSAHSFLNTLGDWDYTFSGIFSGSNLILTATASRGTDTVTLNHTIENYASTYTFGNRFGYGGRVSHTGALNIDTFSISVIPEPSTYALLGMGLGALIWLRRRQRKDD